MKRLLLACALLTGCTATGYTENAGLDLLLGGNRAVARTFPLGDGRTGHEVTCDGARTMSACYQRAAHYCPHGFDPIDSAQGGDINRERSLLFVCRT